MLIQHIEEISVVKDELQEKIYTLESEVKQVKFERDNKESQIVALKEQLGKRAEQKVIMINKQFLVLLLYCLECSLLKHMLQIKMPV